MPKSSEISPVIHTPLIIPEPPFSFLFIRHGETAPNRDRVRCGGDHDVPLTEEGCAHVSRMGEILGRKNYDIGVIVTSDLLRTRQTAQILNEQLGKLPLHIEPLLNERNLGEWNGMSIAETEPLLRAHITPPGGESEEAYHERIERAFSRVRKFLPQHPLIVGSKGTARMLGKVLGGKTRLSLDNAAVVEFALLPGDDGENELQVTFLA
jgi:probable phosphoglycerate mutase